MQYQFHAGQPGFGVPMQQQFQNIPVAPGGLPQMAQHQFGAGAYSPAPNYAPRYHIPSSPHVAPTPAHDDFLNGSEKAVR